MPQMGVSVAEGTVIAWRAQVGDRIEADETICEISTDKIDTEVPAPVGGVVVEIVVDVEATVPVGTVLARISTDGAQAVSEDSPPPPAAVTPISPQASPEVPRPRPAGTRRRYSPVVQ